MKKNINLLISGQIYRKNSLESFWKGFINIQKQLPSNYRVSSIFSHSWNPEYSKLATHVYGEHSSIHETQRNYNPIVLKDLCTKDVFEDGDKRSKGTWKNISFQNVLGNLQSRSRVADLFNKTDGVSLFLRWDFGVTGGYPVNSLSLDPLAPEDYVYISDFNHLDEGYPDMWIMLPSNLVKNFKDLYIFGVECLTLKNDYYDLMTKDGWINSYKQKKEPSKISQKFKLITNRFLSISTIDKLLNYIIYAKINNIFYRAIKRLSRKIRYRLHLPKIQAEIYSLEHPSHAKFSKIQSLNIHSIFKYYFYQKNLRPLLRFSNPMDVYNVEHGVLINNRLELIHCSNDQHNIDQFTLNALALWMEYKNISSVTVVNKHEKNDKNEDFPSMTKGYVNKKNIISTIVYVKHINNKSEAPKFKLNLNERVYKYEKK